MSEFTRDLLNSLQPPGIVWTPNSGSDSDKLTEGKAENIDPVLEYLSGLSKIRDPLQTQILEELEREYGISKNDSLTIDQRRAFLNSYIYGSAGNGTADDLQRRFADAGFDLLVHTNDPATDPLVILSQQFQMVAGGQNAYAGREDAFARRVGGELIVNGDKFTERPLYTVVAGGQNAYAGRSDFFAGAFDELQTLPIEYPVPSNPNDWPFIFFLGGPATRDIDGKITSIDQIIEPKELRQEFLKILLRYKPLHTWCVSVVNFI